MGMIFDLVPKTFAKILRCDNYIHFASYYLTKIMFSIPMFVIVWMIFCIYLETFLYPQPDHNKRFSNFFVQKAIG